MTDVLARADVDAFMEYLIGWNLPYPLRNRLNNALATPARGLDACYETLLDYNARQCVRYVLERTTDDMLRGRAFGL